MIQRRVAAEGPIVTAANREIKEILGEHLGATLVESRDPQWVPDPDMEQMRVDFRTALARLVPVFMPDILFRLGPDGKPLFPEVEAAILPTPFMPCGMPSLGAPSLEAGAEASYEKPKLFGSGTMKPIDYCVALAEGRVPPPARLDIHTIQEQELACIPLPHSAISDAACGRLGRKGFTETLRDFTALNERSKFWGDDQRAAFLNWDALPIRAIASTAARE